MGLINLELHNDVLYASSLEIAERFGKRHADVLRSAEALKSTGKLGRRNFASSSYINSQNKQQPYYLLSRKAFSLIVMGFTGEKALDWKIAYDDAFEQMANDMTSQRVDTLTAEVNSVHAFMQATSEALGITTALLKSDNSECFRDSAKIIGVKETDLINLMLKQKWLYRRANGRLCATARAAQRGFIEEKFITLGSGTEVVARTLLLPKGMHELRKMIDNK